MADRLQIETGVRRTPGDHALSDGVGTWARAAEDAGFDGFVSSEIGRDPFLPLVLAAEHTEEIQLSTRIATAFTRSPMVLAYLAWDLQRYSGGRFALGLGTQVRAHNEGRFSVDWHSPTDQLREVIESLRHIWADVFQTNDSGALDYEGEYYSFSLMTDFFNPGPIDDPDIHIHVAGINERNVTLAGERCDGICPPRVNTPSYIAEKIRPWIAEGASRRPPRRRAHT
ncbi:hypothetical protein BRC87_05630 [Halobacteriales archaeon QS_4_66_20]|nr:MAG: hypothetical protein BRC87_05630 [Halobacteriales archaeon QS_4_66_20]